MGKKIKGYRVAFEDPFNDKIRGQGQLFDTKEDAFKFANFFHWVHHHENGCVYYLQVECVYEDGTYFVL